MGKTFETIINKFDGGLVNDPRERVSNSCSLCKNFDISTNPHTMSPYRDTEDGDSGSATSKKENFAVGLWTAGTDTLKVFGLGVVSGTTKAEIQMKDITTTSADLSDASWTTPAGNASANTGVDMSLFTFYAKTGKIYGARTGNIWAFTPDGSTAFDESDDTLTFTEIGEGLVHSKDDILYVPYYYDGAGVGANIVSAIMSKDGAGAWNKTAITFPSFLKPTSICEYGNYIAVGMTPVNGIGKSFVYLWNRDSTLKTLSESIEWGTGELKVLEEIDGFLVGISRYGNTTTRIDNRIIFRYYTGGSPKVFLEYEADATETLSILGAKQKVDERLYFMMRITKDSVVREGTWSIAFRDGKFLLVHETPLNNDTAVTSAVLKGFIKVGDFLFQSFTDSGAYKLTKTDNSETYGATSAVYHTNINPNMEAQYMSRKKQLVAVSLSCVSLPTSGTAKLEYRVDGGSWVEIFTETTDGVINRESVIDVNGAQFEDGREYEFRITSAYNAEVTELKYKWALLDTQL